MIKLKLWLTTLLLTASVLVLMTVPASAHWSTWPNHYSTAGVWYQGHIDNWCAWYKYWPAPSNTWNYRCGHWNKYYHNNSSGVHTCWMAIGARSEYQGIMWGSPPACWGD